MWNPNARARTATARATWPNAMRPRVWPRSEEHTSELQSHHDLVCRLLLEKKNATSELIIAYLASFLNAVPSMRKLLLFNSATYTTMHAIRTARPYSGRE